MTKAAFRWLAVVVTSAVGVTGCATGGGDRGRVDAAFGLDSGRDVGPASIDTGPPMATDSGGPVDSGSPVDSGGPIDSGSPTDSGGRVGTDAGPMGCSTASDCSDGLACNGIERCELGRCVRGTPLACDDGISCTVDVCEEPGSCRYTPMDSLCPAGQRCTMSGCMSTCSESPCRLVSPQCGCPPGEACYLTGGTRSCQTAGTGSEGTACTMASSCAAGLDCVNYTISPTRPIAQCARYCATDADCVGAGSLCLQQLSDGMGGTVAGVRICTRSCNPVRQTGCAPGLQCNVYRESTGSMRYLTECIGPAGSRTAGFPCTQDTDCAAGYGCLGMWCYRWCNVATNEGCGGSEICTSFMPPAVIGSTEYGVCM